MAWRTLDELHAWSIQDIGRFWDACRHGPRAGVVSRRTRRWSISNVGPRWPRWWVGGKFNYVHNALDKHAALDKLALICEAEEGQIRQLTYAELLEATNRCANALRTLGIKKGDRVGLYLPMIPEVVIAQLALGKLGAIYTPIFSGFGAEAVASASAGLRGQTADHLRRHSAPRQAGDDQGVRRRSRGAGAERRARAGGRSRPTHRHAVAEPARHLVA